MLQKIIYFLAVAAMFTLIVLKIIALVNIATM